MVTRLPSASASERGALITELLVAIAILAGVLVPMAYSIAAELRLARAGYERAVAMEIVDGEMETLLAGGWHEFAPGTHDYVIHANAATNLPPGRFVLTVQTNQVRLEWRPDQKQHGGTVVREAIVK